ncbi:porin [Cupriavidus numazuensis]|uniref:Outer membrane porin protein n=1 Tax=Cupriavidus numazuensis TaxID=221992 RepID=A0ABN7Q9N4_9BURK|nr:porin [Cupriavidus numazuensis]CAG2158921.1 Outer membrane porin protein [Cupriavidus numazuensis]
MKVKQVTAAALLACAGAASAQTSVTLYGVVDVPVEFVNHLANAAPTINPVTGSVTQKPGGNRLGLASNGLSGSRFGLRGTEDLGGGLKALFVLESGVSVDTGNLQQAGRLFGRQAFVGLQSNTLGKLTLGRQYTALFDAFANASPMRYATLYEPLFLQLGTNAREDNVVKYTGVFGGLTTIAHYSFGVGVPTLGVTPISNGGNGEVPGNFRDNTAFGGALIYNAGNLGLSAAYDQWNAAVVAGSPGVAKKAGVSANYTFGPAKLVGGYRWGDTKDGNGVSLLRDDYYWVGVNYQATTALGLTLAYYYDNVKTLRVASTAPGTNPANPWQISFMTNYAFSKRTDVYVTAAYAKNSGLNVDTSANGFGSAYFLSQGNTNQLGVAAGIRHIF